MAAASDRRFVAAVLVASLGLKLAVFAALYRTVPDRVVAQDTPTYERPALALLDTGRFAIDPEHPDQPATLVPPGYPLFLASVYRVAGRSHAAAVVSQIVVSGWTLLVTFALARRLWGRRAAAIAILALGLDLLSFTYSQILFADTLFTAALLTACYAGVEYLLTARARWAAACSAALAAATLVRPISYYLAYPIFLALLLCGWRGRGLSWRRLAVAAAALLMPWLVLVGGWQLRNQRVIGRPQVSDIQAVNLLLYRAAGVVALRDGISFFDAQRRVAAALPNLTGRTRGEIGDVYEREALRIVAAHPLLFVRMEAFGLLKVLGGSGRAEFLHYYGGEPYELTPAGAVQLSASDVRDKFAGRAWVMVPVAYLFAHLVVLYALAGRGLWRGLKPGSATRLPVALLAGVTVYLMAIAAGPEAYARFRVPVMPCLALFAGLALATRRPDPPRPAAARSSRS